MKTTLGKLAPPVLAMPRIAKRIVAIAVDISLCILTVWLAYYLRLGEWIALSGAPFIAVVVSVFLAIPIFIVSGLYRAIFRYGGWSALVAVAKAVGIYALLFSSIFTALGFPDVPRTVGLIQPMLMLIFVGASRAIARVWLGGLYQSDLQILARPKVLIYGAGHAGRQLAAALAHSKEMKVVGFLDDDHVLNRQVLNGLTIYAPSKLNELVERKQVMHVLLAMPSISRHRRNEILSLIREAHVSVRTLPSVVDMAQGKINVSDLRELDLDDLLGREPVDPNRELLAKNITGKIVLVTGAGGSIGSELCRQILKENPHKLLLIEQSEYALYSIHQELTAIVNDSGDQIVPLLASVQDELRMSEIMACWRPQTVYHAAAYKHVPLVEHNCAEGVRNNVIGTLRTAETAYKNGVKDFVLISTDKAVRPTNVMGASKRLAEMVLQALAQKSESTTFSMVRFGNVLGSSGSVVPLFRQQIHEGGPITLTDLEITRYFMTIPEAAQLVIQAGAMANGGDVFVLDMGEPVKIIDLAKKMVELSGLSIRNDENPSGDIEIEITGLRPGEKLYEELLIGDNPSPTSHPRIMAAHEDFLTWTTLDTHLNELTAALRRGDVKSVREILEQLVSGYVPEQRLVDWVYLNQPSING
jgi:FlaA1/EpsC-like NDP-sugar epimerase